MVFNLNEQKVLSGSSGSSVFKGEKDFNDIVVNLPDNIDGHTATELNYVMHFVDSDGGYSTKILNVDSSGKTLKATATVSTSITSKAQAFYAYVLMTDDEETVIGKTNGVIVMIHPVPDEENEIIPPADADKIIKGLEEIVKEATETIEEATEAISSKQDKLTAGENITIDEDNVISAEGGGVTSYDDLTDKPSFQTQWESSLFDLSGVNVFNDLGSYEESDGRRIWSILVDELIPRIPNLSIAFNQLIDVNCIFKTEPLHQGTLNPDEIIDLNDGMPNKAIPFQYIYPNLGIDNKGCGLLINLVDPNIYAQLFVWLDYQDIPHIGYRVKTAHTNWSDLIELGSDGSQIVSGVVNANGTITFTDSDGNSFNTSGSNLVTSGNEQISVGYDNGGFYFLFDDGQGA